MRSCPLFPGSNYSYGQTSSLLGDGVIVTQEIILFLQTELLNLAKSIASSGFPSLEWLRQVNAYFDNLVKKPEMIQHCYVISVR